MKRLIGAFAIAFLVSSSIAAQELRETRMRDLDGDGRNEAKVYYVDKVPVKAVADRDADGFVEAIYHYRNGVRDFVEIDLDKDGRADQWIHYDLKAAPRKAAYDFDHDGQADYWVYYRDGAIYKWEQDRNQDGQADVRTTYETAQGKRELIRQAYDDDFDGVFEGESRLPALSQKGPLPQSWAEAFFGMRT